MKARFIKGLATIVILCASASLKAQSTTTDNYVPNVLPPSPNAAALMKFSDVPVSPYTGTASVTVPIYTIQAKGLSIPIELDYHTGGIKLKEEASTVGLGWALSAGGSISRTIRDKDDFNTGFPYFTTQAPQIAGDISSVQYAQASDGNGQTLFFGQNAFDMSCTYLVNTTGGTEDFYQALTLEGNNSKAAFDMEPDIYSYNFPGHSGKFILTRIGGVVLQKQDNIRITYELNGNSFTILDEKGNKFYFAAKEIMESSTGLPSTSATSSWNISNIITNQGDSVNFTYTSDNTYTTTQPDIGETYSFNCNPNNQHVTTSTAPYLYFNLWLKSISFSSGQLQFVFDGNRSDISGGKKLDAVKLYGQVKSGLVYIKENDLYYSYFVPSYYHSGGADSLLQLRLRLDSVKEISGGLSVPPYSFSYFQTPVSSGALSKAGYNVDHWGYYNGVSNTSFLPSEAVLDEPQGPGQAEGNGDAGRFIQYSGANREADASGQYMQMFALDTIRYPTGGKTVFSYQSNDYDDSASTVVGPNGTGVTFPQLREVFENIPINIDASGYTRGTIPISHIFPVIPNGESGTNITIDCFFRGTGATPDPDNNYRNQRGKISFNVTGPGINFTDDISDGSCVGGGANTCTENQSLAIHTDSDTLSYSGYIDPAVSPIYFSALDVNISYYNLATENSSPTSSYGGFVAGGLRIATVTDYTSDTVVASKREYIYGYQRSNQGVPQNYSYGKLMSRPSYLRYAVGYVEPGGSWSEANYCTDLAEYATSLTPVTSVIQGNIVGYSQVTEARVDPATGQDIGKTVYSYFNSPDTGTNYAGYSFPGGFNMGNNLNGSLLSKINYANTGSGYQPVESTTNYYHTTNRSVYFSPQFQFFDVHVFSTYCIEDTATSGEVFATFYPSIKSERVLLDETVETLYDQQNPSLFRTQTKYFSYDNPIHYMVTRTNVQDSKGQSVVEQSKYPQDYIPVNGTVTGNTNLDAMISANRVAEVIEKRDSVYPPGSSSGQVTGAQLHTFRILPNGYTAPDKIFTLDAPGPVTNFQPFSISGNSTTQDSRYESKISFDRYDLKSDIVQYTPEDQVKVSFLWDYSNTYPIAKVSNADSTSVAYTSFEADGTGSWSITGGSVDTTQGISGRNSYQGGNISRSGLNSSATYFVSYWSQNGAYSIPGTVSGYPKQGKTINFHTPGWTFYIHQVTGQSTITVYATGHIDELRLYPTTAQMTTYTYSPAIGITTQMDADSRATYYEYDGLARLKRVRDQDYNILKTIEYQYQTPGGCGGNCSAIAMQTFAGTNTLSYPVGVFDVNGKLLGNATSNTAYVGLWNNDTADARVGSLALGSDSMHFNITVNAGQTLPAGVTGLRYYQVDLPWNQIDAVQWVNAAYVDFGDGTGVRMPANASDTPAIHPPNTVYVQNTSYIVHNYSDTSLKTITFYHNDGSENSFLDNAYSPASSLTRLRNFRGNLPAHTNMIGGSSFQQASMTSVQNIINWNSISSIQNFRLNNGDFCTSPSENISYRQDFLANDKGLTYISTEYSQNYIFGVYDSSFKLSRLKSDWNSYFTQLQWLAFCEKDWNHEDLSQLIHLSEFIIVPWTQHGTISTSDPFVPLSTSEMDNILIQIAAGAGQHVTNGNLVIYTGGGTLSAASTPAMNFLISRGWTVYIDGVVQVSH